MTNLHPHWHAIDGEPVPVRSAQTAAPSASAPAETPKRHVSRLPAAAVGILIAVAVGTAYLGGWKGLLGQATGSGSVSTGTGSTSDVIIHVATGGLVPAVVSVRPGQNVIWFNDQKVPQIFESQGLKMDDGQNLYTAVIFPGDKLTYHVPETQEAGSFDYDSVTTNVKGTLQIGDPCITSSGSQSSALFGGTAGLALPSGEGTVSANPCGGAAATTTPPQGGQLSPPAAVESSSSASSEDTTHPAAGGVTATQTIGGEGGLEQTATVPPPAPAASSQPAVTATQTVGNSQIPINPYTIGNTKPKTTGNGTNTKTIKTPKPLRQPESGPEVWIAVALSAAVLVIMTRKQLRAYTAA
jgi:hypothetical protein